MMGSSARSWHSQNISKDGMMWQSIVSVPNNEARSWHCIAFLEAHKDVEFLGFVNMYNKANADRTIKAFYIEAIVLYRYNRNKKKTKIGRLIAA